MRLLIVILATLLLAVSVALWAMQDPGYLMIAVGTWTIETSLALAILVVLIVFVLVYYGIRTFSRVAHIPADFSFWRRQRRDRKSQQSLNRGLLDLTEGQWVAAERNALKYTRDNKHTLLNFLAAARAAQAQGANSRRDHYLKLAYENNPGADVVIGLTQAELQIKQGQFEHALATLRHLYQISPKQVQVLKALSLLYRQLGDWEHLLDILPALRKHKVLGEDEWSRLQTEIYSALVEQAPAGGLRDIWSRVPKSVQEDTTVLRIYVDRLMDSGDSDLAEPLLRSSLKRKPNAILIRLYGLIHSAEPSRQLQFIESLLEDKTGANASDPMLLLTAGRLSLRNQLWGKARSYLEASVNKQASAEAFYELGNLLDQLDESEAAGECFRSGLALSPGCEYAVPIAISRKSLQQDLDVSDSPIAASITYVKSNNS